MRTKIFYCVSMFFVCGELLTNTSQVKEKQYGVIKQKDKEQVVDDDDDDDDDVVDAHS